MGTESNPHKLHPHLDVIVREYMLFNWFLKRMVLSRLYTKCIPEYVKYMERQALGHCSYRVFSNIYKSRSNNFRSFFQTNLDKYLRG